MTDVDPGGEVVETADGVTLRKRFEGAASHIPAVSYVLSSDRDEPVTVRVIDAIPDDLDPNDVGFVASAESGPWSIKGPKLVLAVDIDAAGEYRTACTARGGDADAIADLLRPPQALEVDPATEPPIESMETRLIARPHDDEPAGDETVDFGAPPEAGEDDGSAPSGAVAARLVEELRHGSIDDADVALLREELGRKPSSRPSVDVRLKQLQTDVADVRAYTNALETRLESDDAREVDERHARRLDSMAERLDELDERVEDFQRQLTRVTDFTDRFESVFDD